jgi:sec-independent protein translocase protein TatA
MGRLGIWEVLAVLAVLLLFFGPARLPQLGSSIGKAIRNFKNGFSGGDDGKDDAAASNGSLKDSSGAPTSTTTRAKDTAE